MAADTKSTSAVEDIGLRERLPVEVRERPDPYVPEYVWVKLAAGHLPENALACVPAVEGQEPGSSVAKRTFPGATRSAAALGVVYPPRAGVPVDPRLSPTRAGFDTREDEHRERAAPSRKLPHPDYFDQHTSPLNKRRYLDLARQQAFPAFKVGKQVLALRTDVEEFIASRAVMGRPSPPLPPPDEMDAVLARAGLQRKR